MSRKDVPDVVFSRIHYLQKKKKTVGLGSPTTENINTNIERKPNTEK